MRTNRWSPLFSQFVCCAAFAGWSVGLVVATAQAQEKLGTQPVGKSGGLQQALQGSRGCRTCHGEYAADDDYEPFDSWRGSMMGNAARDPVFHAALAIAEQDHPEAAEFCIRCHTPIAWLAGRSTLPEWSEQDGPRLQPDEPNRLSGDLDGIGCAVCHRSTDEVANVPDAPHLENAQLYYLDGVDSEVRLGPYSDATATQHDTRQSSFLGKGDFCGQCHDISNPLVMGVGLDGASTGKPFAIERTFTEWSQSAFKTEGTTCQDCHMKRIDTDGFAAESGPSRPNVRRHDLVGANYWVPLSLGDRVPEPKPELEMAAWTRTAAQARSMLQEAAELELIDIDTTSDKVSLTLRVTNRAGHKLPTGYPEGRRMWLELALLDPQGSVVSSTGLYDNETATFQDDPQQRNYEVKLGVDGSPSFHFALNNSVLEDTRIPPEGFEPNAQTMPIGRDYQDANGAYRHYDEPSFSLQRCNAPSKTLTLRVRLLFQATTREYIEFLRDKAPDSLDPAISNWGQIAYDAWLEHGGDQPAVMAELTQTVAGNTEPCSDAGCNVPRGPGQPPVEFVVWLLLGLCYLRTRR